MNMLGPLEWIMALALKAAPYVTADICDGRRKGTVSFLLEIGSNSASFTMT
jgi:hypothetical protein